MKRMMAIILIGAMCAAAMARSVATPAERRVVPGAPAPMFAAFDVVIDAGATGLGAYQAEITIAAGVRAQLVGIEGGDAGVFADPPAYDPAALHGRPGFDRVILAAFSTQGAAPAGPARVARLHFHCEDGAMPQFEIRLEAAGGADAKPIRASAMVIAAPQPTQPDKLPADREGAFR